MRRPTTSNKSASLVLLCLVIISIVVSACSVEGNSWDRIVEEGQLKIGLDPSFPPFEATDGTTIYGIDVDLANALTEELGLEPTFIHFGYDGLYDALLSKKVDVVISALVIFPERTRDFKYSQSYFDAGQVLLNGDNTLFENLDDLDEQSIGVELGAEGHILALDWQKQKPSLTIATYNSAEEALDALNKSDVDFTIVDKLSALLYSDSTENSSAMFQVSSEPFAMAVREEDTILLEMLNSALGELQDSGQLATIIDTWLGQ